MKKRKELIKHKNLNGVAFSIQSIVAIILTIVFPLVFSFILSLTDIKFSLNGNINFVGFDNYSWVFREESSHFFKATGISVLFSFVSTLVQTILGFLLGMMLYFLTPKLQAFFKTLIYIPVILPSAVISAMWVMIYSGDQYGILNIILGLSDTPVQRLSNPLSGFICLIVTNTWRYVGMTTVIYLVGLSSVDKEVIESAKTEGATNWQIMWKLLLPLTWSSTVLNVLLSLIGGVKSFDLFYLFQTSGNLSSELTPIALLIYQIGLGNKDVRNINLGRSLAMSISLAFILACLTILVKKIVSRKDS